MTHLGAHGRVVIPAPVRKALGLRQGAPLVVLVEDGVLKLLPWDRAVGEAQEIVRRRVPAGRSLVKELLEERRREARRE